MEANSSVPSPINLNCWKHHAGFIKEQIKKVKSEKEVVTLSSSLRKIGDSQMDLYYGEHSPGEISAQIINSINRKKISSKEQYKEWAMNEGKDFKLVELKDKSIWTLRFDENSERYIHIHPGRYSPLTIRVKATTLKTAILILSFEQAGEIGEINTESVNLIRKKYLNEPPLKSFSRASGQIRLIELFRLKL